MSVESYSNREMRQLTCARSVMACITGDQFVRSIPSVALHPLSVPHILSTLNDGSANYLPGILPAILLSVREPVFMAGALMAALLIGQSLQPLMGWIADQIGGKGMIILGISASSVGGALLGLTHNVAALVCRGHILGPVM